MLSLPSTHADTDFVIMDDPLSAVDVHVGRHMFNSCIQGAAAGICRSNASSQALGARSEFGC
jgi:hypothetical protein